MIFDKFSKNFPTTFLKSSWLLYNKALINQLFLPYGKYSDLSFLNGPQFIRSVRKNCGLNILPYGPHNWQIRAYFGSFIRGTNGTNRENRLRNEKQGKALKFFIQAQNGKLEESQYFMPLSLCTSLIHEKI